MYSCCCTSKNTLISFVLLTLVYSSPLPTPNQYSSKRMYIPITQTLNSDVARETSQHQSPPSSIGLHIFYTHLQYSNATQQTRQRRHALNMAPQHQSQNSSIESYISPSQPLNIIAAPQTRQQRHVVEETHHPQNQHSSNEMHIFPAEPQNSTSQTKEWLVIKETPQPQTQNSSNEMPISPAEPQNTTPQTKQWLVVEEKPQLQNENSSSTVQFPPLTVSSSPVLRTRRQYNTTDSLQLPNGPPLRFQRPRVYSHSMRQPIRPQSGQQNHGDILQQRHGDVMQQRHDGMGQKPALLRQSEKRPHGAPQKFCNMFGCDCVPPASARCCVGYRYDKRANKCRQLA